MLFIISIPNKHVEQNETLKLKSNWFIKNPALLMARTPRIANNLCLLKILQWSLSGPWNMFIFLTRSCKEPKWRLQSEQYFDSQCHCNKTLSEQKQLASNFWIYRPVNYIIIQMVEPKMEVFSLPCSSRLVQATLRICRFLLFQIVFGFSHSDK